MARVAKLGKHRLDVLAKRRGSLGLACLTPGFRDIHTTTLATARVRPPELTLPWFSHQPRITMIIAPQNSRRHPFTDSIQINNFWQSQRETSAGRFIFGVPNCFWVIRRIRGSVFLPRIVYGHAGNLLRGMDPVLLNLLVGKGVPQGVGEVFLPGIELSRQIWRTAKYGSNTQFPGR